MKTQNKSMEFCIFRGKLLVSWYKEVGQCCYESAYIQLFKNESS